MDLGNGLLTVSIVCSAVSALVSVPKVSRSVPRGDSLPRPLALVSFASVSCALALLVFAALSSDFTYRYVWEHSSAGLAPLYKLSSVWAGSGGSLLLCTWFISAALVVEAFVRGPRQGTGAPFKTASAAVMSLILAFFSSTVLMSGAFDRTEETLLAAYPDGLGLDVLLQTPEMVAHAPLIFGAYAALCVLFAASATYHVSNDRSWQRAALPWARLAWLLLTAGIGLGAVWAYYVVGWGGYWSWDPVETASLVPWFMVTAFLHTQQRYARKGEYRAASPMLGMMSLVGVVFVSFVVRAGGLWSSSVHDYGTSTGASGVSRLTSLLRDDPSVAGTLAFMLLLLSVALVLTVRAVRVARPPTSPGTPKRLSGYITDQNNMLLAVTLLALAALVSIGLMFKTVGSGPAETFAELDQKMSVLFVALTTLLGLCVGWRLVGQERALFVALAVVGSSVGLALAGAASGAFDGMVAFALPPFVFAVSASAFRLAQALRKGPVRSRAFKAGAQLVHIGVALVLMSYVVSTNLQSYPAEGGEVALAVGAQITVGDYVLRLVGLETSEEVSGYPEGVVQVRAALLDIYEGGELLVDDARLEVLYGYSPSAGYRVLERVAFVESSLSGDLYISFDWMTDDAALVRAKVVPMMLPLWTGLLLLMAGLAMRMWSFQTPSAGGPRDA